MVSVGCQQLPAFLPPWYLYTCQDLFWTQKSLLHRQQLILLLWSHASLSLLCMVSLSGKVGGPQVEDPQPPGMWRGIVGLIYLFLSDRFFFKPLTAWWPEKTGLFSPSKDTWENQNKPACPTTPLNPQPFPSLLVDRNPPFSNQFVLFMHCDLSKNDACRGTQF